MGLPIKYKFKQYNAEYIHDDIIKQLEEDDDEDDEEEPVNLEDILNKYNLVDNLQTDVGTVKLILNLEPEKFIWIDDNLYCWNGNKWEQNSFEFQKYISNNLINFLNEKKTLITFDLLSLSEQKEKEKKLLEFLLSTISTCILRCLSLSSIKNIISASQAYMNKTNVVFDSNNDLLGFNNGAYDLINHEFRPYKYDDYITMSCGYDYSDKIDNVKMQSLNDLIKQIMPDNETRKLYLQILSAGLTGRAIEKFIIFNGDGRNGKGLINEFMKLILGDYALIYSNVSLLTEKDKTGPNPEKAILDNKRYVVMKEPEGETKLRNDRIKDFTGGGNISGRMCNSNKTTVNLSLILVMECNKRPLFNEEPTDAEYERLIDILHERRFSTIPEDIDNVTVFKADSKYKTVEWKESHKNEMLAILIKSFKEFQNNNYQFDVPQSVKQRTNEYLSKSFPVLELFNQIYQPTNENVEPLKLKDVCDEIKDSELYLNLDKKDKRKFNNKYIYEFIEKNKLFRGKYFERKKLTGKNLEILLLDIKKIETDNNNKR